MFAYQVIPTVDPCIFDLPHRASCSGGPRLRSLAPSTYLTLYPFWLSSTSLKMRQSLYCLIMPALLPLRLCSCCCPHLESPPHSYPQNHTNPVNLSTSPTSSMKPSDSTQYRAQVKLSYVILQLFLVVNCLSVKAGIPPMQSVFLIFFVPPLCFPLHRHRIGSK